MNRVRWRWGVCLVGLLAVGCEGASSPAPKPQESEDTTLPPPYHGPVRGLLVVGEDLPEWDCKGWLNGDPKPVAKDGPKVHVLDVWAPWSPHCTSFGPRLAKLHDKYHAKGVQFVSVTDMPKSWAVTHGGKNGIAWPSGYGLSHVTLGELGAVSSGVMAASRGYSIAPTIYVIGRDGKVRGGDDQGRQKKPDGAEVAEKLDALIAKTLAEADAPPKAP